MYNLEEGILLVKIAREAIKTQFSREEINRSDKFSEKRGVFVTLKNNGKLRGCIGYTEPVFELRDAIVRAAKAAAFQDPRFPPLQEQEVEDITVEVSILTLPELISGSKDKYVEKIEIGKHGLIIRKGYFSGLLLPQVFLEYDATSLQALEMTCQKAGLDKNAWREKDAKIYTFSAQIFKEEKPNGEVVEEN